MRVTAAIVYALLVGACTPENGPLMAPGRDCLECHGGGEARTWTAAGTWTRGANVSVTDANGKTVAMRGNKVGNFYTAEPLVFPLTATVDGQVMPDPVTYGGCNLCHIGAQVIEMELMAPGRDCLPCHDGGLATRFSVAGTWNQPGVTVTITDRAGVTLQPPLTTNQAGNFYTGAPLVAPFDVRVGGSRMDPPPDYGGCNACHGSGEAGDD